VVTDDAYDAAVELLTADRCAIIVDLSCLPASQAGLISMCARRRVPAIGVGSIHGCEFNWADFAAVVAEPSDLPAALAGLNLGWAVEPASQTTAERPFNHRPAAELVARSPKAEQQHSAQPAPSSDTNEIGQLLTPQEISALLGQLP